MNKFNKKCVTFLLMLVTGLFTVTALAVNDPVEELNGIANQLISQLKANRTNLRENPRLVYSLANRIVVPHADIDLMAKRVLPPSIWNNANGSQRARFKQQFTTLLVHTYASALANYNDQTVRFMPLRGGYQGRSNIQVNSVIERNDGPSISVNYRLVQRGSSWKLYDLSVEGVSMLESFRSQFSDLLNQGDIEQVIRQLANHNAG